MSKSEIEDRDDKTRTAAIILPQPSALSVRVNHEKSQQWDIKLRSWIPLASLFLGDRPAMEQQAMVEAQRLIERIASSEDYKATARRGVEAILGEFYPEPRMAGPGPLEVVNRRATGQVPVRPGPACSWVPPEDGLRRVEERRQSEPGCRLSSFRISKTRSAAGRAGRQIRQTVTCRSSSRHEGGHCEQARKDNITAATEKPNEPDRCNDSGRMPLAGWPATGSGSHAFAGIGSKRSRTNTTGPSSTRTIATVASWTSPTPA